MDAYCRDFIRFFERLCPLRMVLVVLWGVVVQAHLASAETSVVGSSASQLSTASSGRRSFYDPVSGQHWAFWFNGSAIEIASSPDGQNWNFAGALYYATTNFAVSYKAIDGSPYVFVAVEDPTRGAIVAMRGLIDGPNLTFTEPVSALQGSNASQRFTTPFIALDSSSRVWVAGVRDDGPFTDKNQQVVVTRSTLAGANDLQFATTTLIGSATGSIQALSMVPQSNESVVLIVSGSSGSNIESYRFDGSTWSVITAGGMEGWFNFNADGPDYDVNSIAFDSKGLMYIGGSFTSVGGIQANRVAVWDGSRWSPLGSGVNSTVSGITIDSKDIVYAYGGFNSAGGVSAPKIARWDGVQWSALGSGITGGVNAVVADDDGNIFVGGVFSGIGSVPANYIARWDGSAWYALGTGVNGEVLSLARDSAGDVYAGGRFTQAGGVAVNGIARWMVSSSSWITVGDGVQGGPVEKLALAPDGKLYAGGSFTSAGGIAAQRIAMWDGSVWSSLGIGTANGVNDSILVLKVHPDGTLFVGGKFTLAGGIQANRIASWNGSYWSALGSAVLGGGVNSNVRDIQIDPRGNLVVCGAFNSVNGSADLKYLTQWDGSAWKLFGAITNGHVRAATVDANGNLYIGGDFTRIGGIAANYIARWNGSNWSAVGSGTSGVVNALVADGSGGVYVGGRFLYAGGILVRYIARWDGAAWNAVGYGTGSTINAVALGPNGAVYVGGEFPTAGSALRSAKYIAAYQGGVWSALGSGLDAKVNAIAVDTSGGVYAGGAFTTAGGVAAPYVARFKDGVWSSVGGGVGGQVQALTIGAAGQLYAGGLFNTAGGSQANFVAEFSENSWKPLGAGVDGAVRALLVNGDGSLYAGGDFVTSSGASTQYIARWTGAEWQDVANGLGTPVLALTRNNANRVYAAGNSGRVSYLYTVVANDQKPGTRASLVAGINNDLHLMYADNSGAAIARTLGGLSLMWGPRSVIHDGGVREVSMSFDWGNQKLIGAYLRGSSFQGTVIAYRSANAPYQTGDWSGETILSSSGTARGISSYESTGPQETQYLSWAQEGPSYSVVSSSPVEQGTLANPTATSTSTPTTSPTVTPPHTATPTATFTPTSTFTATFTSTATFTATSTSTTTATFTPTSMLTATATSTPTSTPTATFTSTAALTATSTPTSTKTPTPINAQASTFTATSTPTMEPTATLPSTTTPIATATATPTQTFIPTVTETESPDQAPPGIASDDIAIEIFATPEALQGPSAIESVVLVSSPRTTIALSQLRVRLVSPGTKAAIIPETILVNGRGPEGLQSTDDESIITFDSATLHPGESLQVSFSSQIPNDVGAYQILATVRANTLSDKGDNSSELVASCAAQVIQGGTQEGSTPTNVSDGIEGQVITSSGVPLPGAVVYAYRIVTPKSDDNPLVTKGELGVGVAMTDAQGQYSFRKLKQGRYRLVPAYSGVVFSPPDFVVESGARVGMVPRQVASVLTLDTCGATRYDRVISDVASAAQSLTTVGSKTASSYRKKARKALKGARVKRFQRRLNRADLRLGQVFTRFLQSSETLPTHEFVCRSQLQCAQTSLANTLQLQKKQIRSLRKMTMALVNIVGAEGFPTPRTTWVRLAAKVNKQYRLALKKGKALPTIKWDCVR